MAEPKDYVALQVELEPYRSLVDKATEEHVKALTGLVERIQDFERGCTEPKDDVTAMVIRRT
mgnify:CR=1 FL=1